MKAHKHAEMIKAKADNMELVSFRKNYDDTWSVVNNNECVFMSDFDYFLCLPQHKGACLHWLNCGDIQYRESPTVEWLTIEGKGRVASWSYDVVFMWCDFNSRIKPHKEKRWIGVSKNGESTMHYATERELLATLNLNGLESSHQVVRIEIEV